MDKNAIKKYAIWARRELISRVSQKAEQYGITEQKIIDERADNVHGVVLTPVQIQQRQALIRLIHRNGYRQAMEEVAYTWFNRFIALRFMEVNDYLPEHTRAFTDEQNAFKPKILSDALNLELTGLNLDKVIELKETNKTEELYQYLLITLCNHLSSILPGMFQRIDDYTELLFPEHLLREGSVLEQLVTTIPQDDWLDAVQIIGWLYQYYNAEPKDQVFANLKKNIKISKENIPAATQLFTPDWIVRYMVENSLGRLWVEGHPNEALKAGWKYYLEEAEQEPEVQTQLQIIRSEYAQMKPEDILCIDPCSGSGHILVYLFDVLVQIYEAYGYPTRDAVASIVENNLWGLDIDDRAAQLAYFAVMMKARQYDKGWFRRGIEPHVFALEDSPSVNEDFYARFGDKADAARRVVEAFVDAKEYGSIIQLNVTMEELDALQQVLVEQDQMSSYGSLSTMAVVADMIDTMYPLLQQARALVQKYHVVVTNPPYMGIREMSQPLVTYVNSNYPNSKTDLCTVFMERCHMFSAMNGFYSMINIPSWMFLTSFESLRKNLVQNESITNMIHFGRGVFGADFGTTSFCIRNTELISHAGTYLRLFDKPSWVDDLETKEKWFFERKGISSRKQSSFLCISGTPIAYWVTDAFIQTFASPQLGEVAKPRQGMATSDNDRFMRYWFEVVHDRVGFGYANADEAKESHKKWFPYNKGGEFRKWYGNNFYVLNWENDGAEIKALAVKLYKCVTRTIKNIQFYFKEGITWTTLSIGAFSARYSEAGFLFDTKGSTCFFDNNDNLPYVLALLNGKAVDSLLSVLAPSVDYNAGSLAKIPIIIDDDKTPLVNQITEDSIKLSKEDWDSFETSWDFKKHPIVQYAYFSPRKIQQEQQAGFQVLNTLQQAYESWARAAEERFNQLKANEEELNRIFIDIYGLQDELTPEVADKDVTVRKADLGRDIRSLVSYAVGCMLGRYSIYKDGLMFAGGEWSEPSFLQALWDDAGMQYVQAEGMQPMMDLNPQKVVMPDADGILPITDDDYFGDDIVTMFVNWVKLVFGANELEENLKFIASALYPNGGGSARDLIRQYFLNDFYKDHLKIYQKRPIYWLFDAGKKNSFKCLIYLHRYRPDTVARVRTDYVHEMQARYRTAMEELARRVDTAGGSERVRLQKQLAKVQGQEEELRKYEEKIHHYADMMLPLDLDDGVKVNYAKLQDVLAPIK